MCEQRRMRSVSSPQSGLPSSRLLVPVQNLSVPCLCCAPQILLALHSPTPPNPTGGPKKQWNTGGGGAGYGGQWQPKAGVKGTGGKGGGGGKGKGKW